MPNLGLNNGPFQTQNKGYFPNFEQKLPQKCEFKIPIFLFADIRHYCFKFEFKCRQNINDLFDTPSRPSYKGIWGQNASLSLVKPKLCLI